MGALLNPLFLVSVLLSIGYAALFHLWSGRNLRDLVVYLIAAVVGFALGQWAGRSLQADLLRIGQLYFLEATLGALLALFFVRSINL